VIAAAAALSVCVMVPVFVCLTIRRHLKLVDLEKDLSDCCAKVRMASNHSVDFLEPILALKTIACEWRHIAPEVLHRGSVFPAALQQHVLGMRWGYLVISKGLG
jgi:hypothetical protein